MQSIKISKIQKGKHHWEEYLLQNQKNRLIKYLIKLEIPAHKKTQILKLFQKEITKDNIIRVHQHPIKIFLYYLLTQQIEELENQSINQNF